MTLLDSVQFQELWGVAGARSLQSKEENAAEQYRIYWEVLKKDRVGDNGNLSAFRQHHSVFADVFDANYTGALLAILS